MEQKKRRDRVDVANEPVDFDDEELVDTGILHEVDEEGDDDGRDRDVPRTTH